MKLVHGVGFKGNLPSSINGKIVKSYTAWVTLLQRCYSKIEQKRNPSYIGCTVCDEWLNYENFKKWFDKNYVEGYHLDKDFFGCGKVYSPSNCWYVPQEINQLFKKVTKTYKRGNKYQLQYKFLGKRFSFSSDRKEEVFEMYEKDRKKRLTKTIDLYISSGKIPTEFKNQLNLNN